MDKQYILLSLLLLHCIYVLNANNTKENLSFLKTKDTVNQTYKKEKDALFKAVENNDEEEIRKSMMLGMDPNITNAKGQTPLHIASNNNNLEIVKILISYKANVNTKDNDGKTPLYYAINNKAIPLAKYLIKNGAVDEHAKLII